MANPDIITGYCVKCKCNRAITSSPDGKSAHIRVAKNGRYMLVGWCNISGTKMTKFLTPKKGQDKLLIDEYIRQEEAGQLTDNPPVEVMQAGKSEVNKSPLKKPSKGKVKTKRKTPVTGKPMPKLKGEVEASYPLKIWARYKGKTFKAVMRAADKILFAGKLYTSLSLSAVAITGKAGQNGWKFWRFTDKHGNHRRISEIRKTPPTPRTKRNVGKATFAKTTLVDPTKLPPLSKEYEPVTLPLLKGGVQLPRRNTVKACAAYFVDPKKVRFGHINCFLFIGGRLLHVRYNRKGVLQGKGSKLRIKRSNPTWQDTFPAINKFATKHGLVRVEIK